MRPLLLRSSTAVIARGRPDLNPHCFSCLPTILQWSRRWCNPTCRSHSSQAVIAASAAGLQGQQPLICLERSVGARQGVDSQLWSQGSFDAEVYPDLPVATSWGELFGTLFSRTGGGSDSSHATNGSNQQLTIQTIGCQVRTRAGVKQRLQKAATEGANGALILSGSHPGHSLAESLGYSPSSTEMLGTARGMREEGALPSNFALWAVENPLRNSASRLKAKIEAGAEVVLTQPPLIWHTFEEWWNDVHRMELARRATIVVGVPMLTSVGNLRFWLQLCNSGALPGAAELVQEFQKESGDKVGFAEFTKAYNTKLVQKVLELPGVGGLHIMPLTKAGRQQVLAFQENGTIPHAQRQPT